LFCRQKRKYYFLFSFFLSEYSKPFSLLRATLSLLAYRHGDRLMRSVTLDDKYLDSSQLSYITGIQTLVRLPLDQKRLDVQAGLNTAGFISGYRGSPLGGYDLELQRSKALLQQHDIVFQPGINEDLAATAVWGTQQVNLFPGASYDGVFGLWYGKAPGVDRSGDAFRHANFAGAHSKGGVLLIAGDDHECKSSTLPSQSEYAFVDAEIPVLNPAGVQDLLDLGLMGIALSRYSGCYVGLIALTDVMDSGAVINTDLNRLNIIIPEAFSAPDGLHIRLDDSPHAQEQRHRQYKLKAAQAFARSNRLNHLLYPVQQPHTALIATGKSYLDLLQALDDLGLEPRQAAEQGIAIIKIGMSWPLDADWLRNTLAGTGQVLVIEEKRPLIEQQLKDALYPLADAHRPRIFGKHDPQGFPLLADTGGLNSAVIARTLAKLLPNRFTSPKALRYLERLELPRQQQILPAISSKRIPFYCSGCPHNRSTKVPEGSRAMVGIGCHYIVQWLDRNTKLVTHMGGEGVPWVGQAPFTREKHIFINLGDGTYFHSGILAIRQAVAASVNVTYKLLFNDAVAMTGGQSHDGPLSVPRLVQQLQAEGVARIEVVSEQPEQYPALFSGQPAAPVHHRDQLDRLQLELREQSGVSVIIYDQTCATKKRKLRKRGLLPQPNRHVVINDLVCEGCGDCSKQSNCISIQPLPTEFGVKREVNQSTCNKDTTCIDGFCPSFATVRGGSLKRGIAKDRLEPLPQPPVPFFREQNSADILITGIGGTGVTTLSAILGMAAHLDEKAVALLDQSGLAQKGGAVTSHLRIGNPDQVLHGGRLGEAAATLLLGCDLVTAATPETRFYLNSQHTVALLNDAVLPTGDFVLGNNIPVDAGQMLAAVQAASKKIYPINALDLAEKLLGDQIYANVIVLGYGYQLGLIPLSEAALLKAFELNAQAVEQNLLAVKIGRLAAVSPALLAQLSTSDELPQRQLSDNLDDLINRRVEFLSAYQNEAYAETYVSVVEQARAADKRLLGQPGELAEAVARNLFKLMAYKDEYEVARLYSAPAYRQQLEQQFEGDYKISLHLAPPLLAKRDPLSGQLQKREYGPWIFPLLRGLARLKFLRGSRFDPFGYTRERRMERTEIVHYHTLLDELLNALTADNYDLAVALCRLPDKIRGFGHVKEATRQRVAGERQKLLADFHGAANGNIFQNIPQAA
jgi:indolepyruvate ferredoxin oxidoreductase